MTEEEFLKVTVKNRYNRELLERLPTLGLPECHLVAGCLFQTLWNLQSGREPEWGISDYDVFYYDDSDLSWEAEDRVIRSVKGLTADLPITIDVKNQARVHLWYREHFGADYPQLRSARDGIDRYLVTCTCVGIELASGQLYAPYGLADVAAGRLTMNARNAQPAAFLEKAESYSGRWPHLSIVK